MKKIILFLIALFISSYAHATSLTIPYCTESTGGFIFASHWNGNCNSITSWANNQNIDGTTNIAVGGVQTANIANLSVTDAKIAGITTAGKVNGAAITGLTSLPSGAGTIPVANIPVIGNANVSGIAGSWASNSVGTIYQATTDGFVTGYCNPTGSAATLEVVTDSNSSPNTIRGEFQSTTVNQLSSLVKKNDYYEILIAAGNCSNGSAEFFLPIGS